MKKTPQKVDSYFIGLILEIFILVSLFIFYDFEEIKNISFIMLSTSFFIILITYILGLVPGLILTSIILFVYSSYIIYQNLIMNIDVRSIYYMWMIIIPVIAFTTGKLSYNIQKLQEINNKLSKEYKSLVTVDEQTGLGNIKLFYRELDREISKHKRYKTPCSLMIIKLPYYKEIKKIIGDAKTNKLIRDISSVIISSTRNEDERYSLDEDTLAIIMPNTYAKDANIVKERIKQGIVDLSLRLREENISIDIDIKISVVEYSDNIKSPIQYKILAEEELQYDV